jgi:hypothetical protein
MSAASVTLQVTNTRGAALSEPVDISLRHMTTGSLQFVRRAGARQITINGLREPPDGLYRVDVDPPSYRAVGVFANTLRDEVVSLVCPIDPGKATADFPAFDGLSADAQRLLTRSTTVLGFVGVTGEALWNALDDIRGAGFLNILAKAQATAISSGRTVASLLRELREVRGDRFFVDVPQELRDETKNAVASGLFMSVSALQHQPPDGFTCAGSFKTLDRYGNLQLTFFTNGTRWCADIDIDDAGGIEHVFQVLRNTLTGQPTHPYDIHEILLQHQRLDPQYELVPATAV